MNECVFNIVCVCVRVRVYTQRLTQCVDFRQCGLLQALRHRRRPPPDRRISMAIAPARDTIAVIECGLCILRAGRVPSPVSATDSDYHDRSTIESL
ncbi:hypothetical protein EVAR_103422_1 [Eumeta japonica]|uniref:Uncharacterized protein n=1 Tax=Eumeta variegata TaxID=151549 RepID=A0A4C1ZAS0_EUMVA|nr:hypothetical protein EVAR_103422_1 [Eumeta japonica]